MAEAQALRAEFPIFERFSYLNTCSLGALGSTARARVIQFLDTWQARGASAWYDDWWAALEELRTRYATLVGAPVGSVALHSSISSAIGVVAGALSRRAQTRPKVVVTDLDFPTVAYQWLARVPEGVEVEMVPSDDGVTIPLDRLERAVDDRTCLVATSHVFYTTGAIQDVRAVADMAHRRDALLLVDGYQAAGQLPVDVGALDVDCYLAGGLKWLLGGPGIVFLYVRPELIDHLTPTVTGWWAHRDQFGFDSSTISFHDDARRFETGTPALAAVFSQLGGLDVLDRVGHEVVQSRTRTLTEDLVARVLAAGLVPRVAREAGERSAIVMVPRPDPAADVQRLAEAGVVVDSRPGHVRISPYYYNVPDDFNAVIEVLSSA